MAFTYTAGLKQSWVLDTKQLRHSYYVQLAPDKEHVVLGSLHQGTRPPTGRWLKLGTITNKLAERYFVQQTSFNTLVPGLLIQNDAPPGNTWKDIQSHPLFHVIQFDSIPYFVQGIVDDYPFATNEEFNENIINPVLDQVYPNRDQEVPVHFQAYYFRGRYDQFLNDLTLLTPFATNDAPTNIGYSIIASGNYVGNFSNLDEEPAELKIKEQAQPGTYSIILAVVNDDGGIIDYIFLERILEYSLPQ